MTDPASSPPAIPVANLLRIAFYAGDLLEELEDCEVAREDGAAFVDVLAAMLVRAASRIRLHGFERGYRADEEITSRPRGRMLFGSSIATGLLVSRRIHCTFDDFVTDTPHNRLLKATACRLLAGGALDRGTTGDGCELLRGLLREMRDISDVSLDRRLLRSLPRTPASRRYRVVRFIARLLVDAGQPDGTLGDEWARRLLRDEVRMRRVFEAFVRRFARTHAPAGVRVGRPKLAWSDRPHPLVGGLETDVTVRGKGWTRIIECKYVAAATTRGPHGREMYRPEHLRQLYAYLARTRDSARSHRTIEGVLLYPAIAGGTRDTIDLGGFPVEIVRMALDTPWNEITQRLASLLTSP
jgi:5-methylcytosine-specific restriction enzyme subunit McrC